VAALSKARTVFARSNAGIVGSNPTQGMDVCVCVYSVFVLSCMQVAALRRADHSSKESYCLCINDYETDEETRHQQGVVEPLMVVVVVVLLFTSSHWQSTDRLELVFMWLSVESVCCKFSSYLFGICRY
jgi:hypothetical protein